jgi:hypothetical protein
VVKIHSLGKIIGQAVLTTADIRSDFCLYLLVHVDIFWYALPVIISHLRLLLRSDMADASPRR